ncbi:MAG: PEP/pyruvate-binding domain-containing protein [Deltaproteobacteria bacterium]|nr:PEP/pyruvate-binding domain-containing protein [Deltaproteobacteria bacterium]
MITVAAKEKEMDLVLAYRLYQRMMKYPQLVKEMRSIFLSALKKRGIVDDERLRMEARAKLAEKGTSPSEEEIEEYTNALIDLYFSNHFNEKEIENHINLARKQDRFRNLNRVVNTEGVTSLKIKKALREFCEIPQGDLFINPNEAEGVRVALISHFISNQLPFLGVAKRYITIRDVDEMLKYSCWNPRRPGKIGGKAAGMFLAYRIILPRLSEKDPDFRRYVTIPESYYFNSGIFSDFIDYNNFHHFHSQKYKTREAIEEEYKNISQLFEEASYPPDMVEMFRDFLEKIGEHPLILRSSSLLEDNFGYAFSGKYDSVFVANQGPLEDRLDSFMRGLKRVHMSTYGPAPILYREDHDLLDFDEKMSILVQKVVGKRIGKYFFPMAAGVAFSQNPFRWSPRIRKEDGIVRLVFGLGTRAVDRVGSDYPRMIPLSHPLLRPEVDAAQIKKYSQRLVDVLNLETGDLDSVPFQELLPMLPRDYVYHVCSFEESGHISAPLFTGKLPDLKGACITFENFIRKRPFINLIKKILRKLEEAYGRPIDIEFAWDQDKLYLLQCRTLSMPEELDSVELPEDVPEEHIVFTTNRVLSNSITKDIEYVVYVDPKAYANLGSSEEKLRIGKVVSLLNRKLSGRRYALFGPGRWGSNDINLGVRVGYEDINRTCILAEIAFEGNGVKPEVSSGTHFFNDLIEASIVPIAIYPDEAGVLFREEFFLKSPNKLAAVSKELAPFSHVVKVLHVPEISGGRLLQIYQDVKSQKGIGFLDFPEKNES